MHNCTENQCIAIFCSSCYSKMLQIRPLSLLIFVIAIQNHNIQMYSLKQEKQIFICCFTFYFQFLVL